MFLFSDGVGTEYGIQGVVVEWAGYLLVSKPNREFLGQSSA